MHAEVCRDEMTRCLKFVLKYLARKGGYILNKCGRILIMVEAHDGSIVSHSQLYWKLLIKRKAGVGRGEGLSREL